MAKIESAIALHHSVSARSQNRRGAWTIKASLLLGWSVLIPACCLGTPILFTFQGNVTGITSAGSAFTDTPFTITGTTDTSLITQNGSIFLSSNLSATFSISGVSSGIFPSTHFFVDQSTGLIGLSNPGFNIIQGFNPEFLDYDLRHAVAPVPLTDATTEVEVISFAWTSVSNVTFTAVEPVPEPASLGTLGLGLVGIGIIKVRRWSGS